MGQDHYEPELNFLFEFGLSDNGIVSEIKRELDVIEVCVQCLTQFKPEYYDMLDYLAILPMRKLLCEKKSILLQICPDFKMPELHGKNCDLNEERFMSKLHVIGLELYTGPKEEWVSVSEWLKSKIAWFDKTADDVPFGFDEHVFPVIRNKVNGLNTKENCVLAEFDSFFKDEEMILNDGSKQTIKKFCHSDEQVKRERLFQILKDVGYYDLSIYDFLKHVGDRRGAHVDRFISPIMKLVNHSVYPGISSIMIIAIQMLYAISKQVPGFENYLPTNFPNMETMPRFDEVEKDSKEHHEE